MKTLNELSMEIEIGLHVYSKEAPGISVLKVEGLYVIATTVLSRNGNVCHMVNETFTTFDELLFYWEDMGTDPIWGINKTPEQIALEQIALEQE